MLLLLIERLRQFSVQAWQLSYMIYHSKVRFRLARLRREGRHEEADAEVRRLVTGWAHHMLRLMHCELRVEGREHVPRGEAFVVFSNHQSMFDIPVLIAALQVPLGYVVKRELFYIPGLAFWMHQIHSLELDRSDVAGGAEALSRLGATLKREGRGFIIFPEGTRTRDPQRAVQPFKRGALRVAAEHDLLVLPVTVDGTILLNTASSLVATRHGGRLVRVRIDPPRRLESTSGPARKAFMEALEARIRSNRDAIGVRWPQS